MEIAESLSESITALIAATSEATLGTSNNEGDERNISFCAQTINHPQTSEDRHVEEDFEMPNTDSVIQTLRTEPMTMRKTPSSSSLEERLADKMRWGHIDPRTEWPEWQEAVCEEDLDAMLAARRAHNRQLGKWLEKVPVQDVS